jgi:cullin-4
VESEQLSTTLKPSEYVAHVKDRLEQESLRCSRFFERQSNKEVMEVMHLELISKIAKDIVDRGFTELVKDNDVQSLKTMYYLLDLVKKSDLLRTAWAQYIKVCSLVIILTQDTGVELVMHPERDDEMVSSLLTFKSSLDNILDVSFNSNELFSQSRRESFEWFINRRRDKPAEYIAKYLDNLLRKGDKGINAPGQTSRTLEDEMDRILIMFRYVHGKDVFEAFYKKDLAKRLLLAKSASADAERSMLAKLKTGKL